MLDFRLPKPLMRPREWTELRTRSDGVVLMDLRLVHFSGGPVLRFARSLIETGELAFFLGPMSAADQAIVADSQLDPSLKAPIHASREADAWVLDVLRGRDHQIKTLSADLEATTPTSFTWAAEVFPSSRKEFDDVSWRRFVQDYVDQRGEEVRSLDDLRLLPSVMKRKITAELAVRLQTDLAKALALYSPQDETSSGTTMLVSNPTLHIVSDTKMTAFFRMGDELRERELDWQQAAILDELEESPRIERTRLLAHLERGHAEDAGLERLRPFAEALLDLEQIGLVIGR